MESKIECKLVKEDDLEYIMNWRMRSEITKNMRTHPKLTIEKQKAWFNKINRENTQYHWVIWVDNVPIGVINIQEVNWKKKSCSTGIYIAEKGYGGPGLFFEIHWNLFDLVFDIMHLEEIHAEALDFNKTAIMLNKRMWPTIERKEDCFAYRITKEQWKDMRNNKKYKMITYEWKPVNEYNKH